MEYYDKSRENEEKQNKVISLKSLFGHFRLQKLQEGLEKSTSPHLDGTSYTKTLLYCFEFKAPCALIRFEAKLELFCSGYRYRPNYNTENDHRKRSRLKTRSRVERFENDAFRKRCFLVCTEKAMLSENGDVIIDTTGRQTTDSTVSIQNDGQMRPCGFSLHRRCSVDGRKR